MVQFISKHNAHFFTFFGLTLCLCSKASPVRFTCEPESSNTPFRALESEAQAKTEPSGIVTAKVGVLIGTLHIEGTDYDLYTIILADEGEPGIVRMPRRVKLREGEVICVGRCRGKVEYIGDVNECNA